jgi:hypothetical protein
MSRRCAKTTGRYWRSQGGKRKLKLTGIVEVCPQQWREASPRWRSLAALGFENEGENGEGARGFL